MSISDSLTRHAFGLTILKNSHPDIRRIRRSTGTPAIHGNKFWKSTFVLIDYLTEFPPANGSRILEIGCGWGLGGIYCAKNYGAKLTSLDADDAVFPYLEHHAAINGVHLNTWQCRYEQVKKSDLVNFDVIIAADVCFWDEMVSPLYSLLRRGVESGLRVVMTDPGRPPFRAVAEKCLEKFENTMYDNWSPHPHNACGLVLDVPPKK